MEHTHTNYSFQSNNNSILHLNIASYPYYPSISSWNPVNIFAPNYSGAQDISCKMISADRIAQQFNVSGYFPQHAPSATCQLINQASIDTAIELLGKYWPVALERMSRRGRNITIEEDSR